MDLRFLTTALVAFFFQTTHAQSPTDGLMMPKGNICLLAQYSNAQWNEYWEGTNKRSNPNIGTFTNQNAMLMANYGITDNLNAMIGLPYIWTGSDSYLQGESGLQDFSAWLKYQPLSVTSAFGTFKVQVTGGVSVPMYNYVPDFLPFSIGLQSKTASLRAALNYTTKHGLYATVQAGHTWRSTITLDRDGYLYKDKWYETNEVPVPNMVDATARLGYISTKVQAEFWLDHFAGTDGDDIRYNDAPFPANKMQATTAGVFAKYFVWKSLALHASFGQVLSGRNVGQSTVFTGGITCFFQVFKNQ
ncbi:MAG: hypothetical protein ACKVU2_14650 [Saprospiraceae bacterium]